MPNLRSGFQFLLAILMLALLGSANAQPKPKFMDLRPPSLETYDLRGPVSSMRRLILNPIVHMGEQQFVLQGGYLVRFDANGSPLSQVSFDEWGDTTWTTTFTTDSKGRVVRVKSGRPNAHALVHTYEYEAGRLVEITEDYGNAGYLLEYDDTGRIWKITPKLSDSAYVYEWSEDSRRVTETFDGKEQEYHFDADGNLVYHSEHITIPPGQIYDPEGDDQPEGMSGRAVTRIRRDSQGRMIEQNRSVGPVAYYEYKDDGTNWTDRLRFNQDWELQQVIVREIEYYTAR